MSSLPGLRGITPSGFRPLKRRRTERWWRWPRPANTADPTPAITTTRSIWFTSEARTEERPGQTFSFSSIRGNAGRLAIRRSSSTARRGGCSNSIAEPNRDAQARPHASARTIANPGPATAMITGGLGQSPRTSPPSSETSRPGRVSSSDRVERSKRKAGG